MKDLVDNKTIIVLRVKSMKGSVTEWKFADVTEPRILGEAMGKPRFLAPGESVMSIEVFTISMPTPATMILPIRLTNVDGQLVRTRFFRPKQAL